MTSDTLLDLKGIGKNFAGRAVLHDVSFCIGRGEILSLLGPSGCGKTTILRLIAGLASPDAGQLMRAPSLLEKGRLGYVFQDATLMPWASAQANVALPLILQGLSTRVAQTEARAMLSHLGLADFADAAPHELSGGMKMRVALARALVTKPELLLMDEPFAALDEIARHDLNDAMLGLVRTQNVSVIFVTHSVAEAAYLSDRVAVLSYRPGHVNAEYRMPFGVERHADLRGTPRFAEETAQLSLALGRAMNDGERRGAA
jgi:NitT/TauT family transport system ATP-binding protein